MEASATSLQDTNSTLHQAPEREGKKGTPSYEIRVQGHTRQRGVPGCCIQGHQRAKKGEERELRLQQTPMAFERTSAAAATLRCAKLAGSFDLHGHILTCSKAACSNAVLRQVLANNFGVSLLRSPRAVLFPGRGNVGQTPDRGYSSGTPKRDALMKMHTELDATCHMAT